MYDYEKSLRLGWCCMVHVGNYYHNGDPMASGNWHIVCWEKKWCPDFTWGSAPRKGNLSKYAEFKRKGGGGNLLSTPHFQVQFYYCDVFLFKNQNAQHSNCFNGWQWHWTKTWLPACFVQTSRPDIITSTFHLLRNSAHLKTDIEPALLGLESEFSFRNCSYWGFQNCHRGPSTSQPVRYFVFYHWNHRSLQWKLYTRTSLSYRTPLDSSQKFVQTQTWGIQERSFHWGAPILLPPSEFGPRNHRNKSSWRKSINLI